MSGHTPSTLRQATTRNSTRSFPTGIPSKSEAQKLVPAHCNSINKSEVTSKSLFYCKFRLLNKIAIHHVADLTTAGCQCWQRFACLLYSAPSEAASPQSGSGRFQTAASRKQKASLANLPGAYVTWQKLVPDVRGLFFSVRTWISFSGHPLSGGWNSVVTPLLSFWVFAAGAMTPDLNLFFVRKTFLSIFWATQTQSHGVRVEVDEVNTTASRVSRGVKGCLAELN